MDFSHGVLHTPQSIGAYKGSAVDLDGCSYVRVYWVDLVNVRRCRIVPLAHFKALLEGSRPGVNIAKVVLGLVYLKMAPGFSPCGEYLYAIDLPSLRPLPFAPGHMAVLGRFEEKEPSLGSNGEQSIQVDMCPRTLLKSIIEKLKTATHTEFLVGFESEFTLLECTDPVKPVSDHQFAASTALLANSPAAIVMEEIAETVQAAGIKLEMTHAEAAPGQFEVVTGPLNPMDAADALIFTREIIVQVAAKHGLHATFTPRPFMRSVGSSAHAHISVHSADSVKTAKSLSPHEESFLAGLMDHLPAIAALTLPSPGSYKRVGDGVWSGGTYVCYGTENREAPVRLTNFASPRSRNFEMRFIDGTANPHLALTAIFAGGLSGLSSMKKLEMQDCGARMSAADMIESERQALGIIRRMPTTLEKARANLNEDSVLQDFLGKNFVEKYCVVNELLQSALTPEGESEAEQLTRLVNFY